ncbi:MAG: reverse transcriptase domain-containing protein, partial [bacterium]
PIPDHCKVVRVHNAIQGHPESLRLWERHIHHILQQEKLKPATHERCLYVGQHLGTRILFLRQVDDFAAAAKSEDTAIALFKKINSCLCIDIKILGRADRFNGMDIHQTQDFIKITCERYLYKMLKAHDWLHTSITPDRPTPLPADNHFMQALENAARPNTIDAKTQLQSKMGFHYRQVIGEV